MIFFLIQFLQYLGIKTPAAFEYSSTRMVMAAAFALISTILLGKKFIKKLYELKIGDRIRSEDCPLLGKLHFNKKDTPTMGGILIVFVLLVTLLFFMDLKSPFTIILGLTLIVFGGIGAYDDFLKLKYKNKKGLSATKKLLSLGCFSACLGCYLIIPNLAHFFQINDWFVPPIAKEQLTVRKNEDTKIASTHLGKAAVLAVHDYSSRIYLPFIKDPIGSLTGFLSVFMILMIAFVVTGTSNAVNLTDGLDGLATGTVLMASIAFAIIAFISNNSEVAAYLNIIYIEKSSEIAVFLSAVSGACLGFLWYNSHPAQVFMGDTGSLALGGILGVSAVLLKRELLLAIIGGVFVLEAFSVILQVGSYKLRNKKRIFLCAPLHHHFEYKGLAETKVVMRFWICALLLAILGMATFKFQ